VVATPFVKRRQKVLDGLIFGPEIAQQLSRIFWEYRSLFRDEFFNRRVPLPGVPFRA
jgi:hypothetical protein